MPMDCTASQDDSHASSNASDNNHHAPCSASDDGNHAPSSAPDDYNHNSSRKRHVDGNESASSARPQKVSRRADIEVDAASQDHAEELTTTLQQIAVLIALEWPLDRAKEWFYRDMFVDELQNSDAFAAMIELRSDEEAQGTETAKAASEGRAPMRVDSSRIDQDTTKKAGTNIRMLLETETKEILAISEGLKKIYHPRHNAIVQSWMKCKLDRSSWPGHFSGVDDVPTNE